MKKLSLEEVLGNRLDMPYESQYRYILQLIEEGKIKPVLRSPKNGKKPSLYTQYWIIAKTPDYSTEKEELLYHTDPQIHIDYYLHHIDQYLKERAYVRKLHMFLQTHAETLQIPISRNERSFAIWGEEKFLTEGSGLTILRHCGIEEHFLNCYATAEPFAYYTSSRNTPQKILILENKDPFFGMRMHLLSGNEAIFGTPIETLIYGAGKRGLSSFKAFSLNAEPYMLEEGNELLYFGDLDYEGIGIYEQLAQILGNDFPVKPFVPAYEAMLLKGQEISFLPQTKEKQNRNIKDVFFSYFHSDIVERMKHILQAEKYIPQEILNITDY